MNAAREDRPEDARRPRLVGAVHFWIRGVQISAALNHQPHLSFKDDVGDLEVLEMSTDARVINARFHPGGEGNGYGLVVHPEWRYLTWQEKEARARKDLKTCAACDGTGQCIDPGED